MNRHKTLVYMLMTALFAAMITVMTAYVAHIPTPIGGYLHFGDALIYLAACFLPTPYAAAAGAIGGGLADLLTAPQWMLPTILIKILISLPFTSKPERILTARNLWALPLSGVISMVGYYLAAVVITNGNWLGAAGDIPSSLLQAGGSAVIFVLLGLVMDQLHVKQRITTMRY